MVHSFLLKKMLVRLLPAQGSSSNLLPKPQWEVLDVARARNWGDVMAGPSLPCEKQGTLAGHGQVQAGVRITSEWVGWGISEVMLGHQAQPGQDQAWSYCAGPQR